jgi:hypothetical protein
MRLSMDGEVSDFGFVVRRRGGQEVCSRQTSALFVCTVSSEIVVL